MIVAGLGASGTAIGAGFQSLGPDDIDRGEHAGYLLLADGADTPANPGSASDAAGPSSDPLGWWFSIGFMALAVVLLVVLWRRDVVRPRSLIRSGVRAMGEMPWWAWLIAAFLTFYAQVLGGAAANAALAAVAVGDGMLEEIPVRTQAVGMAVQTAVGLIAGIALAFFLLRTPRGAGLSARAIDVPRGAGAFLLTYPFVVSAGVIAVAIYSLLSGRAPDMLAHDALHALTENRHDPWAWVLAATAIVGAPAVEELVYRGFLQTAILRATGVPVVAIVGTSAAFTLMHVGVMPVYGLAAIFTLSLGLGTAFERTKSLGVPFVMHAIFNAVNVLLAMLMTAS